MKLFGILYLILVLLFFNSCSTYQSLGKYQKRWALTHPIAAIKVKNIKSKSEYVYMELKQKHAPDKYENGGKLDAFRHVFYMAMFSLKIDSAKVRKLGEAHEKDNYLFFLKNKTEDGEFADSVSCLMDLSNNKVGIALASGLNKNTKPEEIRDLVLKHVEGGKVLYVKRDPDGSYVTCDGIKIDLKLYKGKWQVPKCLVNK